MLIFKLIGIDCILMIVTMLSLLLQVILLDVSPLDKRERASKINWIKSTGGLLTTQLVILIILILLI